MQGMTMVNTDEGARRAIRQDAIRLSDGRLFVPTEYGRKDTPERNTKWVGTWMEFHEVGGFVCFSEDQTYIELMLPEGYKFATGFPGGHP